MAQDIIERNMDTKQEIARIRNDLSMDVIYGGNFGDWERSFYTHPDGSQSWIQFYAFAGEYDMECSISVTKIYFKPSVRKTAFFYNKKNALEFFINIARGKDLFDDFSDGGHYKYEATPEVGGG